MGVLWSERAKTPTSRGREQTTWRTPVVHGLATFPSFNLRMSVGLPVFPLSHPCLFRSPQFSVSDILWQRQGLFSCSEGSVGV